MLKCSPLLLLVLISPLAAGPGGSPWTEVEIFDQQPLEVTMGLLSPNPNPDVLAMVLWNDGAQNRINAVTVPAPYDGTGVSNVPIANGASLFAMGDACTMGSTVVVPYINNFNIEVARRNAGTWSTSTIPASVTNNYTTTDCGVTNQGFFITAQDFNDAEIEVFRSLDHGANFSPYGSFLSGSAAGPFSGAIRDQLVTDPNSAEAMAISQIANGPIQLTHFDTSVAAPGSFSSIEAFFQPPVPGSFLFVRESDAALLENFFVFTFNADDNVRTLRVPMGNPGGFVLSQAGPISNSGTQFSFQGGTIGQASPGGNDFNALWGDYTYFDESLANEIDALFPLQGVGGPIERCQSQPSPGGYTFYGRYVGSSLDGTGTKLYTRREPLQSIFADDYETGDLSVWRCDSGE